MIRVRAHDHAADDGDRPFESTTHLSLRLLEVDSCMGAIPTIGIRGLGLEFAAPPL